MHARDPLFVAETYNNIDSSQLFMASQKVLISIARDLSVATFGVIKLS